MMDYATTAWRSNMPLKLFLLLLALLLPFIYLLSPNSFWLDEVFTACVISESWGGMFTRWLAFDVHPPLYFLVAKAWSVLFGTSEVALRVLSYLFYAGALLLYYRACGAQRLAVYTLGLLLMATPLAMFYAIEARTYSLMLLLAAWLVWPWHSKQRITNSWYVALALLSLTHVYGGLLAGLLAACCWLARLRWPAWPLVQPFKWYKAALALLPAAGYMAWLLAQGHLLQKAGGNFWLHTSTRKALQLLYENLLPFGWLGWPALLILAALVGLRWLPRTHNTTSGSTAHTPSPGISTLPPAVAGAWLALATLAGWVLIIVAVNAKSPWLHQRYLMAGLPLVSWWLVQWLSRPGPPAPGNPANLAGPTMGTRRLPFTMGAAMLALGALIVVQGWYTNRQLRQKVQPIMDLQAQARYAASLQVPLYYIMPQPERRYYPPYFYGKIHNYYLQRQFPQHPPLQVLSWSEVPALQPPFALLSAHGFKTEYEQGLPPAWQAKAKTTSFSKQFGNIVVMEIPQ